MKCSFLKTLACKLGTTSRQILTKYYREKKITIPYTDAKGKVKYGIFYNDGFEKKTANYDRRCDQVPNTMITKYPSLVARLKEQTCELCGAKGETTMFQVRSLKSLKGVTDWEKKMKRMNRKTLAVCNVCNLIVHSNK